MQVMLDELTSNEWEIPISLIVKCKELIELEKEQQGYSKADVIKAGEMGEINHHDVNHIISYLDEAKEFNKTYGGNK